jgi:hypothetical protein
LYAPYRDELATTMGFEPHADRRLRRLFATTRNPSLKADLGALLLHHQSVSDAPAAAASDTGASRQPGFSPAVSDFLAELMSSDEVHAELLTAFAAQAKAIQLVWEAHRRGAAELPGGVVEAVERARSLPRFLLERRHSA